VTRGPIGLALAALALGPVAALAQSAGQTYRCIGADGKKYYEQVMPPQCLGQRIDILNSQGQVVRRIDPQGDEKQREAKEAEAAKKREEDKVLREERRRNNALLATYTSEKDIDDARGRALVENDKAIKQLKARIADIKKRQTSLDKEMEFYKEGAAKAGADKDKKKADAKVPKPPPKLLDDIRNAEVDLRAQGQVLDSKQREVDSINAKYDEDKKRYLDLTKPAKK
jgi:hypothetical protein